MDWITGVDYWTGLLDLPSNYVSHDLHPIRCAELSHMFNAYAENFRTPHVSNCGSFVHKRP